MRYARRMNGYSEVPHNGEINNYLRKDLDAKATAKNTACWNLLGKVRTKRTLCFSLYTALELCGVELPRHSTLPQKDFYVTVRSKGTRSSLDNVDYRIWNAKFNSIAFSNGVTCMHPMDAWIQFAQYLNLTELVVLAEALIRRYGYAIEQFTQRLTAFHRVIGRARCEAAEARKTIGFRSGNSYTLGAYAFRPAHTANTIWHYRFRERIHLHR